MNKIINNLQDEKKCFNIFYSFQILLVTFGLIRGTAIGYILYQLDVSPFFLSLFVIINTCSNILSYFLFPYLQKRFNNPLRVLIAFELICAIALSAALFYLFFLSLNNSYGNLWIWNGINFFLFLYVFGSLGVRPLVVNQCFPKYNFKKIIRIDLICLSLSKLIGFSCGVFLVSLNLVIATFLISLIISILVLFFYNQLLKVSFASTEQEKNDALIHKDYSYNIKLSYFIALIPAIFLCAINTQVVHFNKVLDIPFYVFLVFSAMGNLFFNICLNKNISLHIDNRFYLQTIILILAMLCFCFFTSPYILLPAIFCIGGVYTTMSNMATSRIYSSSVTRTPKSISVYYFSISAFQILGNLLLGLTFEFFNLHIGFGLWLIFISISFVLLFILNNIYKFDSNPT